MMCFETMQHVTIVAAVRGAAAIATKSECPFCVTMTVAFTVCYKWMERGEQGWESANGGCRAWCDILF